MDEEVQKNFKYKKNENLLKPFFEVYDKVKDAIHLELENQFGKDGYNENFVNSHLEAMYIDVVKIYIQKNENAFNEEYLEVVKKFGYTCRRSQELSVLGIRYKPIYELLRASYLIVCAERREKEQQFEMNQSERISPFSKK